jgi:tetratricopeptide (TPR) repeat protein
MYIEPWKAKSQNEQYLKNQRIKEMVEKTQTFDLSLSYGKNYLKKAEYDQAIKEFHFALEIFPENKEAAEYLVKAYVQDCKVNERNCKKAIEILDKLIGENPDNLEYQSYRISLEMKIK